MDEFLQFLVAGLTRGSVYAIVGIGFAIIYSASRVINFAQGEFVMIGGMATVVLAAQAGLPLVLAAACAVALAALVGAALEWVSVDKARDASPTSVIIITIGASILVRGIVEVVVGKKDFVLPSFSGDLPIVVAGAAIQPQSLWVAATLLVSGALVYFFIYRTMAGKAMMATSQNAAAANMVGINSRRVLLQAFALSAALGAIAGIVVTPITLTRFDVGVMLGLKGFCAAIVGGMANPLGAIVGGLSVGLLEAFAGGYVSSAYQDAVAFLVLLLVLFVRPDGLLPSKEVHRV